MSRPPDKQRSRADILQSPLRAPSSPWRFRLAISSSGKNEFVAWSKGLTARGRAKRDTNLRFLSGQPCERWDRPQASPLKHNSYVIRFKDENSTEHRLFGFFHIENHVFVICFSGTERDSKYYPVDYEKRLVRLRAEISDSFDERTVDCPWPV